MGFPPLLSICIPTWNRAHLLALTLENLRTEIRGLESFLEVVIADNASSDDTAEVVRACGYPVVYGRQSLTVGITRNIFFATCDLAGGDFVWLIGDDDLIVPGGVRRVIESLQRESGIDYHYINFGWVDVKARERLMRESTGHFPDSVMRHRQFEPLDWRRLDKGEDLAFLSSSSPSSMFAGIFCYAVRRDSYIDARQRLNPSDSLDGSSTILEDNYPQAMITASRIIGRPVAYIGTPCILQGINGWEWKDYATKTVILGQHDLLVWLEKQGFDKKALAHLRASFIRTVGDFFARMLLYPDKHMGVSDVIERAIPGYSANSEFWGCLTQSMRDLMSIEADARLLVRLYEQVDVAGKRIGMLGFKGRGEQLLATSPELCDRLSWIGDNDATLEGYIPDGCLVPVASGNTAHEANLDILLLAIKAETVTAVAEHYRQTMKEGSLIVCVKGVLKAKN